MKKLIIFTLLLMFSINTLSFAQDTSTPEKERNWIVGIGSTSPAAGRTLINRNLEFTAQSLTIGYKGFTVNAYYLHVFSHDIFYQIKDAPSRSYGYFAVGYQHVFSKQSNAKVKPIVGLELGMYNASTNVGVRYKRSQILLGITNYNLYNFYNRNVFISPFGDLNDLQNSMSLKYQFLF